MKDGLITTNEGHKFYYVNGKLHNDKGPAVEYIDGHKEYYINNVRHRKDGPAFIAEYEDGTSYQEWWYKGKHIKVYNQKEFERWIKLKAFL